MLATECCMYNCVFNHNRLPNEVINVSFVTQRNWLHQIHNVTKPDLVKNQFRHVTQLIVAKLTIRWSFY